MDKQLAAILLIACLLFPVGVAFAEWSAEFSLEGRWHTEEAVDPQQHSGGLSLSGLAEYYASWDGGDQQLVFKPFFRTSEYHDGRAHVDIRELYWLMSGDDWELRVGVDKVFWGVTEAYHLVDVINQADLLENPDGEQKLGQPMIKYSHEGEVGVLDAYLLLGFRERAFPNEKGRLRTHPMVDVNNAQYETHKDYPGFAARWSGSLDDWDLGLAYFHGISREPRFELSLAEGVPVLTPHYDVIDQVSLDVQLVDDDWLWKFETLYRSGSANSYAAATGGFEYTFVGIADTDMDLGVLLELIYDDRAELAATPFNRDVFIGLRWVGNDVAGTEVLAGLLYDQQNHSRFLGVEASRRLVNDWKFEFQLRRWLGIALDDPTYAYRQDDYFEAKLIKYL